MPPRAGLAIFLVNQDIPHEKPVQILKPHTMQDLKRSVMKALRLERAVMAIYNSRGDLVRSVRDFEYGETLSVSTGEGGPPLSLRPAPAKQPKHPEPISNSEYPEESKSDGYREYEEDEEDVNNSLADDKYEEEREGKEERLVNEERAGIGEVFAGVVPEHGLDSKLQAAFEVMPAKYRQFFEEFTRVEEKQSHFWLASTIKAMKRNGFAVNDGLVEIKALQQNAVKIIQGHSFANAIDMATKFRLAVSGPKKAGKTTMLSVLADQFVRFCAGSGSWKRTFIFAMNGDVMRATLGDPKLMLLTMIKLMIPFITAQNPILIPHEGLLTKYFTNIVEVGNISLFPKRFVEAPETAKVAAVCRRIAQYLVTCWKDPTMGELWANAVCGLPLRFAREMGYENVVLFIDNFESMNFTMLIDGQFPESPDIYLTESFKLSMIQASFALSYENANDFEGCLQSIEDGSIDMLTIIDFESVLDIEYRFEYSDKEIILQVDGQPVKVPGTYFGSAPGFLPYWITLNKIFDMLDKCEKDSEDYEDYLAAAMNETQKMVPLIFNVAEGSVGIEDVRRR